MSPSTTPRPAPRFASVELTIDVLRDPVSVERAKPAFDTFVDPAEIHRVSAIGGQR